MPLPLAAIPAGVSAVSWMSNIAATGLPWATQAASTAASAVPTFMQPAANWALPFLNPATAGAGAAEVGAATAGVAEVGAGAAGAAEVGAAATAAGAEVGAGGAGAAAGGGIAAPAAAVVGAGLAGLAAGTGMAVVADDYGKGGMFGQNEYGQQRSGFDWASDQGHAVGDFLGGGTVGDIGGAVTAGALSIPAGVLGFGQAIGNGIGNAGASAIDAVGHWFE